MNRKLENFIKEHRNAFDDHTPSDALWERIKRNLDRENKKTQKIIFLKKKWLQVAAAAALIFATSAIFYLAYKNESEKAIPVAANTTDKAPDIPSVKDKAANTDDNMTGKPADSNHPGNSSALAGTETQAYKKAPEKINEEALYHYSRLIEIKQNQMAVLQHSDPELYKEFSADMETLGNAYQSLERQFKQGLNSEKLLEAMIRNLKMQTDLLNKQLGILKQVHYKKQHNDDEKYKSL